MLSDNSDSCPFLNWFDIFGLFIEIYRGCHYSIVPSGVATKKLRVRWGKKCLTLESDSFHPVESDCMEPSNILLILISEILKCKTNVQSELMKYRRYHVCKLTLFVFPLIFVQLLTFIISKLQIIMFFSLKHQCSLNNSSFSSFVMVYLCKGIF